MRALLLQRLRNPPAGGITGHRPLVCGVRDPLSELRVEASTEVKRRAAEEVLADVRDAPARRFGFSKAVDYR